MIKNQKTQKSPKVSKSAKQAAWVLIGLKVYNDYIICLNNKLSVEPEHFYEIWMKRNVERPSKGCLKYSWIVFRDKLFAVNTK